MFNKKKKEPTRLDICIEDLYVWLDGEDPFSDNYTQSVRNLQVLEGIRESKKPNIPWKEIAMGVTSIAGILLILNYEKLGAVTSKATMFLRKP